MKHFFKTPGRSREEVCHQLEGEYREQLPREAEAGSILQPALPPTIHSPAAVALIVSGLLAVALSGKTCCHLKAGGNSAQEEISLFWP